MAANPTIATSALGHMRRARSGIVLIGIGTIIALTFLFVSIAAAQQTATTPDPNAIMGFESLGTWDVRGSAAQPGFMVTSTTNRTQGSASYSISNPPNMIKLVSLPIASTATALADIGNAGALLQIDVLIPVEQGNAVNSGWIRPFVTSPSRGLNKVSLGKVDFNNYRPGIYNTIGFAIPDEVNSALGGATFSDLTFEFDVSSPGKTTGTYLFDNLRVHSVQLEQSPTGTPPPPGYGGSVNLVVFGNAPVTQTFDLGPTQIPNSFHLKMGSVGATTVQLQLGLDGNPALTCTYDQATTGGTYDSYTLQACSNGFEAGDLVNANWVQLAIVGGDSTQEIRAQIAMRPMGDLTGAGLLPPMPTFWGDADTCIPAPVPGTVVTTSASCSQQTAEANQIINDYFTQVVNANPAPNWIVPPVPEWALLNGGGTASKSLREESTLASSPDDPSPAAPDAVFDTSKHANEGGNWDAYWELSGHLTPTAVAGTDQNITHFDATYSADVVLWGNDVHVMVATLTADTTSAETTPVVQGGTSSGTVGLYVLGNDIPPGGFTVNPSQGFSADPKWTHESDLLSLGFWIFSLKLGASATAELNAAGDPAPSGLKNLSFIPSATLGAHVSGGVDITLPILKKTIASGTVNADVDLIKLDTPVSATANWAINSTPDSSSSPACAISVNGNSTGTLTASSGGGKVYLNANFGICPNHCWTESQEFYSWPPPSGLSGSSNLFTDNIANQFRLPPGLAACGTWQGTYSGETVGKDGKPKSFSGTIAVPFTQKGTSVSAVIMGYTLTGTNINGNVILGPIQVPCNAGTSLCPAGLSGTISSDSSTFSGYFYINRPRTITGTFSLQPTTPQP